MNKYIESKAKTKKERKKLRPRDRIENKQSNSLLLKEMIVLRT